MALELIQPFEHGLSWVVDESMQRASHALVVEGSVWLVDPVDEPEALEQVEELGSVAGVVQLLDRHNRDGDHLAERFGVPLHRLPDDLPGTPFQILPVLRSKLWDERAIWWPDTGTLVVAEQVGSTPVHTFGTSEHDVGIHPMMRSPLGPTVGDHLPVQHLLVGHGAPIHVEAATALASAYSRRYRDLLSLPRGAWAFISAGRGS